MLKRGIVGTYHMVSAKHLQAYVDEFSGRHNLRGLDTVDQMGAVAGGGWPGSSSAIGSSSASCCRYGTPSAASTSFLCS